MWVNKENFDNAIKDSTEAIRLNPRIVEAYQDRGNARIRKGELDTGIKDLTEAVKLRAIARQTRVKPAQS
jgi:tetratricopeptide (TPR) repeat protein